LASYQQRAVVLEETPAVIHLESVKGCPYSCAMCHFRHTKPRRVSQELLDKIEPYYDKLEVLAIHGLGEPLLSDLDYLVEKAVNHNFVLHMNTTAFFMTHKISDLLLRARLSIRFSIHSGKPKTYQRLMGHDFHRVRENISYLLDRAKDLGDRNDFWCSFLVMKENIEEIEDFLFLIHSLGINNIRFMHLNPNWYTLWGVRMAPDFTFKYLEQTNKSVVNTFRRRLPRYREIAGELGVNIRYGNMPSRVVAAYNLKRLVNEATSFLAGKRLFPLFKGKGSCLAPWFGQLIIRDTGWVKLCCAANCWLGNLHRESLEEIWNSKRMQRVREVFQAGYLPRICGYCQGFSFGNYPGNAFCHLPGARS
jgi:MoaA/NifB/PqqE/SkfB family radical SAM enzyme